jgi:hypothetical protein
MRLAVLVPIAALAACAPPQSETAPAPAPDGQAALAAEIEKAVGAMLPDITVSQYARHYARGADGHVHGVYLRQCDEGWATCAGAEAIWVSPEEMPITLDGGCAVVRVEYDPASSALVTATCNGEA